MAHLFRRLFFILCLCRSAAAQTPHSEHLHSWEAPSGTVGETPDSLREHERIGPYQQPRYTANRRFINTPMYVAPPSTLNLEYQVTLWQLLDNLDPSPSLSTYLVAIGIGGRAELIVSQTVDQKKHAGPLGVSKERLELRYAIADWGALFGNPTLSLQYERSGGPARLQARLYLAEIFLTRLHAAASVLCNRELTGELRLQSYGITTGIAYVVSDERLAVGAEVYLRGENAVDDRSTLQSYDWLAGPALSFRPIPAMRVLFTALFGISTQTLNGPTPPTSYFVPSLVLGWEV